MLQLMAQPMTQLRMLIAAAAVLVFAGTEPALAQHTHEPFLQRDTPPTAWYFDGRDDVRDFQNNGFYPGDFAAHPADVMIGAAGLFGMLPTGGSHFGQIYCTRQYRAYNPRPGYFQGADGIWYRCRR